MTKTNEAFENWADHVVGCVSQEDCFAAGMAFRDQECKGKIHDVWLQLDRQIKELSGYADHKYEKGIIDGLTRAVSLLIDLPQSVIPAGEPETDMAEVTRKIADAIHLGNKGDNITTNAGPVMGGSVADAERVDGKVEDLKPGRTGISQHALNLKYVEFSQMCVNSHHTELEIFDYAYRMGEQDCSDQ